MQWSKLSRSAIFIFAAFVAYIERCNAKGDVLRMEEVIQSYVSSNKFMGSVLMAGNAQILLDRGYSYANLEWLVPNSPDAKSRLGSVTKQFTAACILLLEEPGKLKTDDPARNICLTRPRLGIRLLSINC